MKIVILALMALLISGCGDKPQEKEATATTNESVLEAAASSIDVKLKGSVEAVEETVEQVQGEVVTATEEVVAQVEEKAAEVTVSQGATLYQRCASCHGATGEKQAFSRSAVINTWTAEQIEVALNGYKDGSYGRDMKDMMQAQVKNFTAEEISALANHIAKK